MSSPREQQHNLKVAELAYAAFNAGDLETLLKLTHEDVEVYVPEPGVNAGTYRGREGYRQWYEQWMESFEDYKATVLEVVPIGRSHLVVMAKQTAKGKGSGAPVEMDSGNMLQFRGGKVFALHFYPTREEAMAAAEQREADEADE
jgi:ketosteroid isomerase-like protein